MIFINFHIIYPTLVKDFYKTLGHFYYFRDNFIISKLLYLPLNFNYNKVRDYLLVCLQNH